jgi:hypothetical protein
LEKTCEGAAPDPNQSRRRACCDIPAQANAMIIL